MKKQAKRKKAPASKHDPVPCVLCDELIPGKDAAHNYCHGCSSHVCESCCVNLTLMGPHLPEDHQTPEEE